MSAVESGCGHEGRTLLPYNGTWVGAVVGDVSARQLYCFECGEVFEVTRKNIEVETVGNLRDRSGEP